MFDRTYDLEVLPYFEAELQEAVDYIQYRLRNPPAAAKLVDAVFDAIRERQKSPLAFEAYPSAADREHPYYRIAVGNYLVLYVVIGNVMEVRRFIYQRRNWHGWGL